MLVKLYYYSSRQLLELKQHKWSVFSEEMINFAQTINMNTSTVQLYKEEIAAEGMPTIDTYVFEHPVTKTVYFSVKDVGKCLNVEKPEDACREVVFINKMGRLDVLAQNYDLIGKPDHWNDNELMITRHALFYFVTFMCPHYREPFFKWVNDAYVTEDEEDETDSEGEEFIMRLIMKERGYKLENK